MKLLSRLKVLWPKKPRVIIYRAALREADAQRADALRREWLSTARQAQSDAIRFSLLAIGGGLIAMLTLVGVIIQAGLAVDLSPLTPLIRYLTVALVCLISGNVFQASVLGWIALSALHPEAGLLKPGRRHRGAEFAYYVGWIGWVVAMIMVLFAVYDAFGYVPHLLTSIQDTLAA